MRPEQLREINDFLAECACLGREDGTSDFRAARLSGHRGGPSMSSHKFYELTYCAQCNAVVQLENRQVHMQEGDISFIPPGVLHNICSEGDACLDLRIICFNESYARHYLAAQADILRAMDHFQLLHTGTDQLGVQPAFDACIMEVRNRQRNWERICQIMIAFLLCVAERHAEMKPVQPSRKRKPLNMLRVMDYIDANLAGRITLEDTAQAFSVSPSTLSQTFRRKNRVSFYAYVTQRRLESASSYIAQGLPLGQIGQQVGFSDYSAFYRAFKHQYGISPREYRDKLEL